MQIEIIRCDGSSETREIDRHNVLEEIYKAIGCQLIDAVNLRDGRVMLVDDTGLIDRKPVNPRATELYHTVAATYMPICGDVALVNDADFE